MSRMTNALPLQGLTTVALPRSAKSTRTLPLQQRPRVAEFFAGIGLVRLGLTAANFEVVWANDISSVKHKLYVGQFTDSHFILKDIRGVSGADIPDIELATASFPCTDLSLAGHRRGLRGDHSGLFWEFVRVLREMGPRRPQALLVENVTGFLTSRGGEDLRIALAALNELGYWCDLLTVDARHFVPQSRPRLFIVASRECLQAPANWWRSAVRSEAVSRFMREHSVSIQGSRALRLHALPLDLPELSIPTLADIVERLPDDDPRWWEASRLAIFQDQLTSLQRARLDALRMSTTTTWATMYRRTRANRPAWEIRDDQLSGCLRAVSGGSSRQALVEAGDGEVRVRWMTAREYARLQGAPDYRTDTVTENQALFGFGDAVCVPLITWLATQYLSPLLSGALTVADEVLAVMP